MASTKVAPETRYVRTADGVYIAYQAVGSGPDLVVEFNAEEGNVDLMWEEPDWSAALAGAAEFARVIVHDRRATGASSRNVPPPNLETQASDLLAVLDAVGSERPVVLGGTTGGQVGILFAATYPERIAGLIWNNAVARTAWAPDYPWGLGSDGFEREQRAADSWGTTQHASRIARVREAERRGVQRDAITDADLGRLADRIHIYARIIRNTASPDVAREISRIEWETDVRGVLGSVRCPVALVTGTRDEVDETNYIASMLPNAVVRVVEGRSGLAMDFILDVTRQMLGTRAPAPQIDTVLKTVLFTDVVESTAHQVRLGDRRWKELIKSHHAMVREALARWRGVENDTAGDGFYATFDGPARAVRCALEIVDRVRELGIEVRAGIHTGECEIVDGKATGMAVTIGARVCAAAGPSEILITQTVKDLVAGSDLVFSDRGLHSLKGVPREWRLLSAD